MKYENPVPRKPKQNVFSLICHWHSRLVSDRGLKPSEMQNGSIWWFHGAQIMYNGVFSPKIRNWNPGSSWDTKSTTHCTSGCRALRIRWFLCTLRGSWIGRTQCPGWNQSIIKFTNRSTKKVCKRFCHHNPPFIVPWPLSRSCNEDHRDLCDVRCQWGQEFTIEINLWNLFKIIFFENLELLACAATIIGPNIGATIANNYTELRKPLFISQVLPAKLFFWMTLFYFCPKMPLPLQSLCGLAMGESTFVWVMVFTQVVNGVYLFYGTRNSHSRQSSGCRFVLLVWQSQGLARECV